MNTLNPILAHFASLPTHTRVAINKFASTAAMAAAALVTDESGAIVIDDSLPTPAPAVPQETQSKWNGGCYLHLSLLSLALALESMEMIPKTY